MDAPDNTWRTLHITQACPNNDGMCAEDTSTGGMRVRCEVPGSLDSQHTCFTCGDIRSDTVLA